MRDVVKKNRERRRVERGDDRRGNGDRGPPKAGSDQAPAQGPREASRWLRPSDTVSVSAVVDS